MYCKNCGKLLPDDAKFCLECGTEVSNYNLCPGCSKPLEDGAKFCAFCGYSIIKPTKPITIEPIIETPVAIETDKVEDKKDETNKQLTPEEKRENLAKSNKKVIPLILFITAIALFIASLVIGPAFVMHIPLVGRMTINSVNLFSIFGTELDGYRLAIENATPAMQMISRVVYAIEITCILTGVIVALVSMIIAIVKFVKFTKDGTEYDFYKPIKVSFITIICCLAISMLVNGINLAEYSYDELNVSLSVNGGGILFIILTFIALSITFILKRLENPNIKIQKSVFIYRAVSFGVSLGILLLISHLTIFIEQYFSSASGVERGNYTAFAFWVVSITANGLSSISHWAFILALLSFGVISIVTVNMFKTLFDFFENREFTKKTNLFNIISFGLLVLSVVLCAVITLDSSFHNTIVDRGEGWASIVGIIIPTILSLGMVIATKVFRKKYIKN